MEDLYGRFSVGKPILVHLWDLLGSRSFYRRPKPGMSPMVVRGNPSFGLPFESPSNFDFPL